MTGVTTRAEFAALLRPEPESGHQLEVAAASGPIETVVTPQRRHNPRGIRGPIETLHLVTPFVRVTTRAEFAALLRDRVLWNLAKCWLRIVRGATVPNGCRTEGNLKILPPKFRETF